jgi:hypothetical protein
MNRRRVAPGVLAAVALAAAWWIEPIRDTIRRTHLQDTATGLLLTGVILLAARWVSRTQVGPSGGAGATVPGPQFGFRTIPLLWAGFAVSIYIAICSVRSQSSSRGSYFDRVMGQSVVSAPAAELVGQGIAYATWAVLLGWPAHAAVVMALGVLTGGPSFVHPAPGPTVDDYANGLRKAGWSVSETHFVTDAGPVWQVDGRNGENVILARAPTQAGAWRLAVEQAVGLGMLSR